MRSLWNDWSNNQRQVSLKPSSLQRITDRVIKPGEEATTDAEDQWKIRVTLGKCIHSLQVDSHASNVLVNIYTEKELHQSVDVNKRAEFGVMTEFQDDFPGAFKKPLTTKVLLKKSAKDKQAKRKVNKDNNSTDLLLSRTLLFLGTSQLQLDQVFSCELAPFRT